MRKPKNLILFLRIQGSCIRRVGFTPENGKIRDGAGSILLSNLILPHTKPCDGSNGSSEFNQVFNIYWHDMFKNFLTLRN